MRDWDTYSSATEIDLYIPSKDKEKFLSILSQNGWLERKQLPDSTLHHFYYKNINNKLIALDVKFDFVFGKKDKYFTLKKKDSEIILSQTQDKNGLLIPDKFDKLLLYFIHLFCEKDKIKKKHKTKIQDYLNFPCLNSDEEKIYSQYNIAFEKVCYRMMIKFNLFWEKK